MTPMRGLQWHHMLSMLAGLGSKFDDSKVDSLVVTITEDQIMVSVSVAGDPTTVETFTRQLVAQIGRA